MFSSRQDRDLHYAVLTARLQPLRAIFSAGTKAQVYSSLFDEFLSQREFGLALEALCDYLLEPTVRPVNELELKEIASLHVLMEVEDQCLLRLRQKREQFEKAPNNR